MSIINHFSKRMTMICLLIIVTGIAMRPSLASTQFIIRDHIVIDIRSGVEWLRCSVGQTWNGETCTGEIVKLNHDDIEKAIVIANEQLGGNWRLPSLAELEGIVCYECDGV